jgi:three-Cys-motif partner protein
LECGSLRQISAAAWLDDAIVAAFRDRLKDVAGFKYVPDPLPMKNSNNAVVYYLFLASQKAVAEKIIGDIFAKYR